MSLYALKSAVTGDCYTNDGRLIVHGDRDEMQWLIPAAEVVDVTGTKLPTVPLPNLPGLEYLTWPLRKEMFW